MITVDEQQWQRETQRIVRRERFRLWILRTHFYWCRPWLFKTLLIVAIFAFSILGVMIFTR